MDEPDQLDPESTATSDALGYLEGYLGLFEAKRGQDGARGRQDRAKMDMACILPMKNGYF